MINPKYIPIKIKKKGKTYTLYNIFVFKNTIKKQRNITTKNTLFSFEKER